MAVNNYVNLRRSGEQNGIETGHVHNKLEVIASRMVESGRRDMTRPLAADGRFSFECSYPLQLNKKKIKKLKRLLSCDSLLRQYYSQTLQRQPPRRSTDVATVRRHAFSDA